MTKISNPSNKYIQISINPPKQFILWYFFNAHTKTSEPRQEELHTIHCPKNTHTNQAVISIMGSQFY
jgi:hypothetical protein